RALHRAERLVVGGDLRLTVHLHDQRNLAGELPRELRYLPDLENDRAEVPFLRQLEEIARVGGVRVVEEVARTVLEALVDGKEDAGAVGRPVRAVEDPVQPGALARGQAHLAQPGHEFLLAWPFVRS